MPRVSVVKTKAQLSWEMASWDKGWRGRQEINMKTKNKIEDEGREGDRRGLPL